MPTVHNICSMRSMHSTHNATFVTWPHISAATKPTNPLTLADIKDRQTSVPSAARSADCVKFTSGSVLPVAQWTWYGTCMQLQVADRQEEPAVSVHYHKLYSLYGYPYINGAIKFVTSSGNLSFSRSQALHTDS